MLEKLKYKNILKTINQFITDENFKNNLNILISDMEQISEYTLSINHQRTGYINWSGKLNNEYLDLKIIINKNSIEYIYDVSSKNSTIYGKFYKIKNHSIAISNQLNINYCDEYKTSEQVKKEISIFDNQCTETFKYIEQSNKLYQIKNKQTPNQDLLFTNQLIKNKIFKTSLNNVIKIQEYISNNTNYKNYFIGYNINEKYLNVYHDLFSITPEDYIKYKNKEISEEQLLNKYKGNQKSMK